jgi:hypothetical protein
MFNLSKKEYLLSIGEPFQKMGFKVIIKDKRIINDSYVALTITNQNDYLQIKIKRSWTGLIGLYPLSILSSNLDIIPELDRVNRSAEMETGYFNSKKIKFHKRLYNLSSELKKSHDNINTQAQLKESTSRLQSNPIYQEQLSVYDFVQPAIGIESDNEGNHLIYGITVGGDRAGGILLFNPIKDKLETESYIGFGRYGDYNSFRHDRNNKGIIEASTSSLGSFSSNSPDIE